MKFTKTLLITTLAMNYQIIQTSFRDDQLYKKNCESLQTALTLALDAHNNGQNIQVITPMELPFTQNDLVTCRKNYELQHPGVFQKSPAIIRGTHDGLIMIDILTREEADDLCNKVFKKNKQK